MSIESNEPGVVSSVNRWSRLLGVSLRPWSGHSPVSLLVSGAIQLAICAYLATLTLRLRQEHLGGLPGELEALRGWTVLAIITLAVVSILALARVAVGVLDLLPRRAVVGTVLSLRQRRVGDILPVLAQRAVFAGRNGGMDRRRTRTELVLQTARGARQWTVRNARVRRELRVGTAVRISVSPLLGYVAKVEPHPG